jgi:hypothetical protein
MYKVKKIGPDNAKMNLLIKKLTELVEKSSEKDNDTYLKNVNTI